MDIRDNLNKGDLAGLAERLRDTLSHTRVLQKQMWLHAEALNEADRSSEAYALFTSSLNDLMDAHTPRITVFNLCQLLLAC